MTILRTTRLLFPVIFVFLILETGLWGLEKVYLERKVRETESFRPTNLGQFSLIIDRLRSQNLELTWDKGRQKKILPLAGLTSSFFRTFTGREDWHLDREKLFLALSSLSH